MKKKVTVVFVSMLAMLCLLFTACPTDGLGGLGGEGPPAGGWGGGFTGDSPTGFGTGYHGQVSLVVHLVNGEIIDLTLGIAGEDTARFATPARMSRFIDMVVDNNSFEFRPDLIRGATVTVRGLQEAGASALAALDQPGGGTGGDCGCP